MEAPSLEIFLASLWPGETVTETEMVVLVLDVKELWWYFTMFWICFRYVLVFFKDVKHTTELDGFYMGLYGFLAPH